MYVISVHTEGDVGVPEQPITDRPYNDPSPHTPINNYLNKVGDPCPTFMKTCWTDIQGIPKTSETIQTLSVSAIHRYIHVGSDRQDVSNVKGG